MTDRRTGLRRRVLLAVGLSAIGLAGRAPAQARDLVDLSVIDRDTGQVLQVWRHDGRAYVAGRPGARYGLRVTNNSDGRVLVVMSVDGVNVLSGETAAFDQRGYVFDPHESYDVTGWRKSRTEVAAFTFAPLPKSYAARTGRPADVGVIGIAAFRERVYAPPPPPPAAVSAPSARSEAGDTIEEVVTTGSRRAEPAPNAPSSRTAPPSRMAAAQPPSEKLGTGHGAREWSSVTTVAFVRSTAYPVLVRRIEYDSYENLLALGVIRPAWDRFRHPRPFPAAGDGQAYVPDPPGGS